MSFMSLWPGIWNFLFPPPHRKESKTYFEQTKDPRGFLEGIRFPKLVQFGQSAIQMTAGTHPNTHRYSLWKQSFPITTIITY